MSEKQQEAIDEAELVDDLEPSEAFAELIGRVGNQVGVGSLSLGAVRTVVQERAGMVDASAAETSPCAPPAKRAP